MSATWISDLGRDARHAARTLARAPGFVAVAVVCLALGIGANAAIFSAVNAVLLRPLPYAAPDRLVRIWESRHDNPGFTGSVSVPNYRDWAAEGTGFSSLAAYFMASRNLQRVEEPARLLVAEGTANLFATLGVAPMLGRTFAPDEDQRGRGAVVVLSEPAWRARFGGDPAIVGRTLVLDGAPHTVIGVMPAGFTFPAGSRTEMWLPHVASAGNEGNRGNHYLSVIGRLRAGATAERATAQLAQVAARLEREYPDAQAMRGVRVVSLRESVVGRARRGLVVLLGAVGFVLLIACANVANLHLARATARRQEMAVRVALGAGAWRLVRQLLVEGLMLALLGAALGLVVAHWSLAALRTLAQRAIPFADAIALDAPVFLFMLVVAVGSGALFALAPALQALRADVRQGLSDAGAKATATGGQQRLRAALVVGEIALSLVLLVGAGLLGRAFLALRATEPGLDPRGVLTAHLAVAAPGAAASDSAAPADAAAPLLRPVLERARAIPGVREAGMISMLPIQTAWTNGSFRIVGDPEPAPGAEPMTELRVASPGLFRTLGIPLHAGRDFTEEDGVRDRVVIVNRALARKYLSGRDPIGMRIGRGGEPYTIVGVVGDVRQAGLDQEPMPELYYPYADPGAAGFASDMTIVLKAAGGPARLGEALAAAVRGVSADQPIYRVQTMDEVIAQSLADRRLALSLLGAFAVMALVLSSTGIYGVIAYLVEQRRRELGIRMAFGARPGDVVRLVMRQGARLAAAGIAIGLAGALALTRLLEGMLYGVSARDPLTFGALAATLGVVALAATFVPARRATRVDPMLAMRAE